MQESKYENAIVLCPELNALSLTLKRHDLDFEDNLHEVVNQKLRNPNFNLMGLAKCASNITNYLTTFKVDGKKNLGPFDLDSLEGFSLGLPSKEWNIPLLAKKHPALLDLIGPLRSHIRVKENTAIETSNDFFNSLDPYPRETLSSLQFLVIFQAKEV